MVQKYQNEIAPIFYYGKSPKTNGNLGVIKKNPLILDYGRDSVERPKKDEKSHP